MSEKMNNRGDSPSQNGAPRPGKRPEPPRAARLKSAQSLITAAVICGPISLIIGGVLLSGIGIICASIAYWKLRGLDGVKDRTTIEYRLRRQSIFMIAICVLAFILNAISLVQVMPVVMESIQGGVNAPALGSSGSSSVSSVWG